MKEKYVHTKIFANTWSKSKMPLLGKDMNLTQSSNENTKTMSFA